MLSSVYYCCRTPKTGSRRGGRSSREAKKVVIFEIVHMKQNNGPVRRHHGEHWAYLQLTTTWIAGTAEKRATEQNVSVQTRYNSSSPPVDIPPPWCQAQQMSNLTTRRTHAAVFHISKVLLNRYILDRKRSKHRAL